MSSNPYEYHNDQLGVQAAFLFEGRNQHEDSLCLIGDRGLRHRIKSGKICRLRAQGPNTPLLVTWLSLPPQWQRALIDRFGEPAKRTTEGRFVRHFIRDTRAYDFYLTYKFSDGSRINEDHKIEEYTLNASVLNTLDLLYRKQKSTVIGMRGTPNSMVKNGNKTTVWDICAAECDNFKDIQAHTLPSNSAALRRKLREYKNEGYQSIIHGNWCNKSARKVFSDEIELLNNLFADVHEKPTATEVSRRYDGFIDGYVDVINNATGEMYNPADYPKLSNATITNYLAKWVNKAGTHAIRSGNRQVLMSKFKLYHTLEQPKYAGSIISIDDRQPPFEYADGKRAWFYNAIDLGSEAITCWVYGTTKEGIIDDFYRQLVRNYSMWGINLPLELEGEMSLNSKFVNSFLQDGAMFAKVRIEANNARGKRIEAYYRQLRYGIEKSRVGWIARPFAVSEPNQASSAPVPLVPYEHIIDGCLDDIVTWNNMEHSKHKGVSRWKYFLDNQHPDTRLTNWRAILPHIGYKTETSCNVGQIRLQNQLFVLGIDSKPAYSDRLIPLMELIEGKDIDVYWLDGNDSKILKALVYIAGTDQYVCEAVAKPTYSRATFEQTDEDRANREAMSKYVASVEGFINSRKRSIEKVTVINNRPRTIANDFQIPGLRKPVAERIEPVEVMDEPDDDFNNIEMTYKRTLKDRY